MQFHMGRLISEHFLNHGGQFENTNVRGIEYWINKFTEILFFQSELFHAEEQPENGNNTPIKLRFVLRCHVSPSLQSQADATNLSTVGFSCLKFYMIDGQVRLLI